MLPKMSEEKAADPVAMISTENEVSYSDLPPRPRSSYRKYVIIAVTLIVVTAIVLTAILVALHFFTEAQKDIVKFSYNRDGNTKEDVTSDPNTNVVQYHASNPNYEMWVVDDFNRDIQVMKIQADSGTNCYVAPLNRTTATDPSKVSAPSNPDNMTTLYTVSYQVAKAPIPDSSFLCQAAKDTCRGISTYWVYPRCETPQTSQHNSSETSLRQKRASRWSCDQCYCKYCNWFICVGVWWC